MHITVLNFSMKWKISKVIPLLKGKEEPVDDPSSYRPISIVPVCSKLVEMTVAVQIKDFMNSSNQWNTANQAYKKDASTTMTLLHLTDYIFQACDKKKIATTITVDESAAFDCIKFDILDKKLKLYNFGEGARKWVRSYLDFRTFYVNIGAANSRMMTTTTGVPQGTVLGPTLYSIYINEMSDIINEYDECDDNIHTQGTTLWNDNCKKCGMIPGYTHDTTFVTVGQNRTENEDRVRTILNRIKKFLNSNGLTVNTTKMTLIEIMLPQKHAKIGGNTPTIETQNDRGEMKTIRAEKTIVVLGCILQNTTSWQEHLEGSKDSLLPRLCKQLGLLKYIGRDMSFKSRKLLANGLILSRLSYICPVWGGTSFKYKNKLQVLLNNTARWVTKKNKRTHSWKLIREVGWLDIEEQITYNSLNQMWKIVKLGKPEYIANRMEVDTNELITTNEPRLLNTTTSFRWRTSKIWNTLLLELRSIGSLPRFKSKIKTWLINKRTRRL